MTREEIINATGRIVDLHVFNDILTSGTPGAERLFDAIAKLNISNPMALASYLLSNKEEILVFCDDKAAEINIAKVNMLMYAAKLDGRTESKDKMLNSIVDRYDVYDFVWNDAINRSPIDSEKVLAGLPFDDRVAFMNDVKAIFDAGGDVSENQQGLIDRLNDVFGIVAEHNNNPLTKEEILRVLENEAEDVYDFLSRGSINSYLAMNFIQGEEPKTAHDVIALIDQVREKFLTIPGSKPSANDIEIRKAKIGVILLAAISDGNMNDKEKEAVNQIINSFEFRVPDPDYATIFNEYKGNKAIDVLKTAKYGERIRLINSVNYIFNVDGPINQKEIDLMLTLLYRLEIQPKDTDLDLGVYGLTQEEETEEMDEPEDMVEIEEVAVSEGWTCPECGHTENKGKFCEECGTKKPDAPETWTCPKCGHTGNKGKFCSECGTKKGQHTKGQNEAKGNAIETQKGNETTSSIEFKKVSIESYDGSLVIMVDAIIRHSIGKNGRLVAWFFNEDGSEVKFFDVIDETEGQLTFSGDEFTPDVDQYELQRYLLMNRWEYFNLSPGGTYRFKVQLGTILNGEHLPYSDFIDFKVTVKKTLMGTKYKIE